MDIKNIIHFSVIAYVLLIAVLGLYVIELSRKSRKNKLNAAEKEQ